MDAASICKNKKNKGLKERDGGDGHNPNPKNMGELMPAAESHYWRQNLKVIAQRTMNTARKLGPHTQNDRGTCPAVGL
jgi:hypothetical protein